MGWRVGIELTRGYGAVHSHEAATGNGDSAGSSRQSYHPQVLDGLSPPTEQAEKSA